MSKTTEALHEDRRDFLKGLLLAGGALGAGVGLETVPEAAVAPIQPQAKPARRLGYRETEYVRKYYAKASP
jgi:anaerobic selenocysteine-containing dehydrogenase